MNDSSPAFMARYRRRLESLSDSQRLLRALDMFDHGKCIMRVGIRHDHPELTDAEVEQRLFLRMYGDELPPAVIERALARIAQRFEAAERQP